MAKRKNPVPPKKQRYIEIKLPRITEDTIKISLFVVFLLIFMYMLLFSIGINPFSNGKYAGASHQYVCHSTDSNCGTYPDCQDCNTKDGLYGLNQTKIEAESFTIVSGFASTSICLASSPSGGRCIRVSSGTSGEARTTLAMESGTYEINITHVPESVGNDNYTVLLNNIVIDSWTASQGTNNWFIRRIAGIAINPNDVLTIKCTRGGSSQCRVDFVNFTKPLFQNQWVTDPSNECREVEQRKEELRNYFCSSNSCTYSVTSTNWVNTGIWRNKPDGTVCTDDGNSSTIDNCSAGFCIHIAICFGTDTSCGTNTCTNCNLQDNWYNTTNTIWVDTSECTEKEQIQEEFRDYRCNVNTCNYVVTNLRWVDTGSERNKTVGMACEDGNSCTTNDICNGNGVCVAGPICNIPPSPTCNDAKTLRIFNETGTCLGGVCDYSFNDTTCNQADICGVNTCVPTCQANEFAYVRICKSYTATDWNRLFTHQPPYEYRNGTTYYSCISNNTDVACCSADNSCVYNGNCYGQGTLMDVDYDGFDELCVVGSNGQWIETEPGSGTICTSDDDCATYEYCDTTGQKTGIPFTCFDFRQEMTGCKYYDFCQDDHDPTNDAVPCSSNWDNYCFTADAEQAGNVRQICEGASFASHTWFTCPIG